MVWTTIALPEEVHKKLIDLQYKLLKEKGKKIPLYKIVDMLIEGKLK